MSELPNPIENLSPEKRELLELLLKKQGIASPRPKIVPRPREGDVFPLSYGQKALWFLHQFEPQNVAYNISSAMRVLTPLDIPALRRSFRRLVDRHASLRTTFSTLDDEPRQRVHTHLELCFQEVDAAGWSDAELHDFLVEEARRPFDLELGPLFRVSVVSRSSSEHVLLMVFHHIITDLWSLVVLTRELGVLYPAERSGSPASLPTIELQYTDYVLWQAELLRGPEGENNWSYWKQQLAGELPVLDLQTDHPRPPAQTFRGASQAIKLSGDLTRALKTLGQDQGATLYMVLLAAYEILLHHYTGQKDILIGSPMSGRSNSEVAGIIGYFVNTVVMRADLSNNLPFKTFLGKVRQTVLGAFDHQDYPFALLTERLHPSRDFSRSPVFQTMFVLQKAQSPDQQDVTGFVQGETKAQMNIGGLLVEFMPVYKGTSQFDLRLTVAEVEGGLSASFNFNPDLFDAGTITSMLDHYRVLLESIVADPEQRIFHLPILNEHERKQLLVQWNKTVAWYPRESCIQQLFEAQVEKTPDALALVFEEEALTYRQLNERANQLAHHLQTLGVGPETFVGICVKRSVEMVVGLLGVLKSGGAYVPLDPNSPPERLTFMLRDADIAVLLTQERLLTNLPPHEARVICLDADWQSIARSSTQTPVNHATATNTAYVIYTSGSTGQPKGVVLEHRSTVALIYWARSVFTDDDLACVLASATINFDCSVFEIYVPLSWGGKIILARHALELATLSAAQEITLLNTVPSSMAELLRINGIRDSVRTVNLSGETLSAGVVAQLSQQPHIERIHNGYGPTEDTTFTTFTLLDPNDSRPPPIGRPISNEQIYLLDRHGNPVPRGLAGELHIGGAGLARGYLNRPDLTAERFVPNPFSSEAGARLYRTGDVARYRANGDIEFVGRIDYQVKIRGFRIEPGEVEAALLQNPMVREAVVIAREDMPGVKRLVAYIVPAKQDPPNTSELRSFLKEKLPEYMVPSVFMILEALPLTLGCKVDRGALPAPEQTRPDLARDFVAPRNATEELLANIWLQVLNLESVGVFDNFFDLGGDSIISVQVISRAKQAGVRLTTKQLFKHQTIAGLAAVADTKPTVQTEQGLVTGAVPLTPIQRWFFERNIPDVHHWNLSMLLEVREALDASLLEKAVGQLLLHHDALRLRFERAGNGWRQLNSDSLEPPSFSVVNLSEMSEDTRQEAIVASATKLQSSLNLSSGPLIRVALFELGPQQPQRLLVIAHHLTADGISWRILLEDLHTAYVQLKSVGTVKLLPKTSSYQRWAERLVEYAESVELSQELPYWLKRNSRQASPLPLDYPEGSNTAASARALSVGLSVEETSDLLQKVSAVYHVQINEVLLTALARAFSSWTGQTYLLIDLEGHGREELFPEIDLSRTVGWFTTTFPVELDQRGTHTPLESLNRTQSQLRRIPNKGIGYGVMRYLTSGAEAVTALRALPGAEVSFNYLGQFDQVLSGASPFRPALEYSGPSRTSTGTRSYLIDITARVVEGQFRASWTYSENIHERATLDRLARDFVTELKSLINSAVSSQGVQTFSLVPPSTPVEEVVASVWSDLLQVDQISRHDDFFVLGGNLSSAQQAVLQLNEIFEIDLPSHALWDAPTVAKVSSVIDESLLEEIEGLTDQDARGLLAK